MCEKKLKFRDSLVYNYYKTCQKIIKRDFRELDLNNGKFNIDNTR